MKVSKHKKDKNTWYNLTINAGTGTRDWVSKVGRTGKIKSDPSRINKPNLIRFYQFIYKDSDPKFCLRGRERSNPIYPSFATPDATPNKKGPNGKPLWHLSFLHL